MADPNSNYNIYDVNSLVDKIWVNMLDFSEFYIG